MDTVSSDLAQVILSLDYISQKPTSYSNSVFSVCNALDGSLAPASDYDLAFSSSTGAAGAVRAGAGTGDCLMFSRNLGTRLRCLWRSTGKGRERIA